MAEHKIPLADGDMEQVSGGSAIWERSARGSFTIAGDHIVYTAAEDDVLSAVAARYNVTVGQIESWNGMAGGDALSSGQQLTIYANTIR